MWRHGGGAGLTQNDPKLTAEHNTVVSQQLVTGADKMWLCPSVAHPLVGPQQKLTLGSSQQKGCPTACSAQRGCTRFYRSTLTGVSPSPNLTTSIRTETQWDPPAPVFREGPAAQGAEPTSSYFGGFCPSEWM